MQDFRLLLVEPVLSTKATKKAPAEGRGLRDDR